MPVPGPALPPSGKPGLAAVCDLLLHPLEQLVDVVLVARKIGGEIGTLGQPQTGAAGEQIDDPRVPASGAVPRDFGARLIPGLAAGDGITPHRRPSEAFDAVIGPWRGLCIQLMRTTLVANGSTLAAPIIGWVLCAPKYLVGTMSLGEVAQAVAAFVMVQTALNWLVDNCCWRWMNATAMTVSGRRMAPRSQALAVNNRPVQALTILRCLLGY